METEVKDFILFCFGLVLSIVVDRGANPSF